MRKVLRDKKIRNGFLVGLAIAALVVVISNLGNLGWRDPFQGLELKTYDMRYYLKLGKVQEQDIDDIVIVDIDDASLAQLGRFFNWPRLYHAKLLDYVRSGGAAAVAYDIFFTESDSLKPEMVQLFHDVKSEQVKQYLTDSLRLPKAGPLTAPVIRSVLKNWGYDQTFSEVSRAAGNAYFPMYFNTGAIRESTDIPIRQYAFHFDSATVEKYNYISSQEFNFVIGEVVLPVPALLAATKGVGYYNVEPDDDGIVRRQPLFLTLGKNSYPSMDLAVVLDKLGITRDQVKVTLGKCIKLGDKRRIPIDRDGRMLITYFGQFKKFRYISYADVLTEKVPADYFRDKIVLVGTSAVGLMDLRAVPFVQSFPGPEIHANIMHTLLTGKFVTVPPWQLQLMLLILLGLLTTTISIAFKPVKAALILLGLTVAYSLFAIIMFGIGLVWIDMVRTVSIILFTNMGIWGYRYLTEEKQKLWIKNMFQGYMSKDLVDKIMANPELLLVGGDKKEITVFFSDIRGFSSFSEKLGSPERLIALINEYLGAMSDVVLERGGYISKYEGDAIMAFWGAPSDDPRHAETCIQCVWAMNQKLQELNADLAARSMPNLFTRFGINTGWVTVGNVGSERKKSYTAMGDSVNLGSRLEGANKEYGTAIMISEFTYEKVKGLYPVRELDLLRVVGKEQPVRVYELLGLSDADVPEAQKKAVEQYLKGLELYRARKWDEAIKFFNLALAADPEDGPSKTYIERCEEFKASPPPENWDGVFVMKTK
ncbi:MAG: CHASE2 domain-containing protein [Candidatus Edwardsbacteria bacterium]|nr:CHASE2 domain-containing protein [Candidatus Edwardsbacteria bacterium]